MLFCNLVKRINCGKEPNLLFTCRRNKISILCVGEKGHTKYLTMARWPLIRWFGSKKKKHVRVGQNLGPL